MLFSFAIFQMDIVTMLFLKPYKSTWHKYWRNVWHDFWRQTIYLRWSKFMQNNYINSLLSTKW